MPLEDGSQTSLENEQLAAGGAGAAEGSQIDSGTVDAGASAAAAAATPPASAETPAEWSLRSQLQQLGLQGEYSDDRSAWGALETALRQQQAEYQRAQQVAQYYLANQQQIQAALAAQQAQASATTQPAAAKPNDANNWWSAPEWKPEWQQFLKFDQAGNVTGVQWGADPSLPIKHQAYRTFQRERLESLLRDPIQTLKPGLESLIESKAQELIQKHLGSYSDQQFANQYVGQQSDWMYAKQANGAPAFDSLGQRMLSPAGQKFASYVREAEQMGIKDIRMQQQFAERMTQREALATYYQQHQAKNGQQQAPAATPEQENERLKQQAVRGGARRLPASGAGNGQGPRGDASSLRPRDVRLSFGDRLSKRLKEAGISDVA